MPPDVRAGLAWLSDHKESAMPEEVSICHLDFHPLNLMVDENEELSVIDWSGAALGDRHADIANTLVLLRAPPIAPPETWLERLMIRFGGPLLAWLYLRRYRQQLPVDEERLHYWEAFSVFDWWQTLASYEVDPASGFLKTDIGDRIRDGQLKRMRDYFARVSKFSPN
jgi:aminoglycoside phosphotransferase (APT) family kinase protein